MSLKPMVPTSRTSAGLSQTNIFQSLQHEIDRLFDDFGRGFPALGSLVPAGSAATFDLVPRMDVAESDDTIEVTTELPGLEEKDVEVTLADNVLTIRGEKKAEKDEKTKDYRLVERRYGSFSRRLELPPTIEASRIEARFANGVLTVTIPKAAPSVAKKIEVKAAA